MLIWQAIRKRRRDALLVLSPFDIDVPFPAGSGLHTECNVGSASLAISSPCLLNSASASILLCKVHLTDATFTLSSANSSQAHMTGSLTSLVSQAPLNSQSVRSRLLTRPHTRAAQFAAISQIADRRQDHSLGHWSHPALLDCSLHLAASLASPAGTALPFCIDLDLQNL